MGTSNSNSVGSSPRWKKSTETLVGVAGSVLVGPSLSVPTGSKGGGGGGGGAAKATGPARSVDVRSLGVMLIEAHRADPRFLPLLGDCAAKVALEELLALSGAATLRYRTQRDAPELFKEYGVNTDREAGLGLSKVLDKRFRQRLVEKCGSITDNAEKARRAIQQALVEMLAAGGGPDAFRRMNAGQIHDALRKTGGMDVTARFYKNYIFNTIEFLVSSSHADIPRAAEDAVVRQLRATYCEEVAAKLVRRARSKAWLPGQIPEKVDEWRDLLVEGVEAHA
jgi:hypothetical protein